MMNRPVLSTTAILISLASVCAAGENKINKPVGVVVAEISETLVRPEGLAADDSFDVAKTPARIRFSVVEGLAPFPEDHKGNWSSWGQSILASDGNFYSSISDHRGVDGRTYIIRYEPKTGRQTRVFDSYALFDHVPGTYGHGKLHGRLDEYPKGYLIGATYWGIPPIDTKYKGKRWTGPIPGGRLIRVDLRKGTTEDLGVPFARDSWTMFATDTRRGIFHAIGYDCHYLAYDLKKGTPLYAALPPPNIHWYPRATLVDEVTGNCYSTSKELFVKYDPKTNRMTHLTASVPDNPHNDDPASDLRAYTERRGKDGSYICQSFDGMVFKFFPDTEKTETIDVNWGKGFYCTAMAMSPGERYVYYTVDVHGSSFERGSPVVQYDLVKKRRKVLAFLHSHYLREYRYVFGGSYAITATRDGAQLFITWNGKFRTEVTGGSFGDPTFMLIDVPASERIE